MLNGLAWYTSSIWSTRPWHSTQLMPRRDVDRVVEINVIRHHVDLHPRNGRVVGRAVADDLPGAGRPSAPDCGSSCRWTRREDWRTMIFPRRCGNSGSPCQAARRGLMRKRHRLHRLVADAGVFGREIIGHARRHAAASQRQRRRPAPTATSLSTSEKSLTSQTTGHPAGLLNSKLRNELLSFRITNGRDAN